MELIMIEGKSCGSCDFSLAFEETDKANLCACNCKRNPQRFGNTMNRLEDVCSYYECEIDNIRPRELTYNEVYEIIWSDEYSFSFISDEDDYKDVAKSLSTGCSLLICDGYDLAKHIESDTSFLMSTESVEELESVTNAFSEAIRDKVKRWVKKYSIAPKFDIGEELEGFGVICGYYEDTAKYKVKKNKEDSGRWTVYPYERLEALVSYSKAANNA
jgi:hypothetical protein